MQIAQHTIQTRTLGKGGPQVSQIGFGCMGLSAFYPPATPTPQALDLLEKCVDLGCNMLDTADMYGENEELIARFLQKRPRADVLVATKFGVLWHPDDRAAYPGRDICGKKEYVHRSCVRSLARLGVDCIDLYFMHRVDPDTPIEETVSAMADLVKQGKVKYLGLSECSAETLRRAYAVHPIAAVQMEYSPWALDIEENGLLDAAKELGVAIIAYSPLGRGFLTGKYKSPQDLPEDDFRRSIPRFSPENFPANLHLARKFQQLAAARPPCTPAQLVLAWILKQGDCFIPIPGTTNPARLEENMAAAQIELTDAEDAEIRAMCASVKGERYSESLMKMVNQ
ncbi:MAG: hypothetical protein SGCHY_002128 [Lobulomycetales sp.]